MAGVAKIKKEDIINAALEIIKEKGIQGLNARNIAKKARCSIQPIFYQFNSMDELKNTVYNKIYDIYKEYMLSRS